MNEYKEALDVITDLNYTWIDKRESSKKIEKLIKTHNKALEMLSESFVCDNFLECEECPLLNDGNLCFRVQWNKEEWEAYLSKYA